MKQQDAGEAYVTSEAERVGAVTDDGTISLEGLFEDYTQAPMYKLYHDAPVFELKQQRVHSGLPTGYWTAWYAARCTASALLTAARKMGVTPEQWEELRKVAAHVAAD